MDSIGNGDDVLIMRKVQYISKKGNKRKVTKFLWLPKKKKDYDEDGNLIYVTRWLERASWTESYINGIYYQGWREDDWWEDD